MSRLTIWKCDYCDKTTTAPILPLGWLEVSFYNNRWFRYYLCSYSHLTSWAESREQHYGSKCADNH